MKTLFITLLLIASTSQAAKKEVTIGQFVRFGSTSQLALVTAVVDQRFGAVSLCVFDPQLGPKVVQAKYTDKATDGAWTWAKGSDTEGPAVEEEK